MQALVNTHPLTKVDPQDLTSLPLRSIHFLQGNLKFFLPESSNSDERECPSYGEITITNIEQAKEALNFAEDGANSFWIKRILDRATNWPLGRIVEHIRASDGPVRSARVITSSGKTSHRLTTKLVPLEIRSSLAG
ncbi:unnamed protein product [Haemonchus placei]|uniref:DUF5641 domain-containing protein n=1 Tax=Haemonchus placei TaxID=6290 RepID=A0A0N4WJ57_HAEPC|nr:unnamed protein product [Haemonchus placei]